MCSSMLPSFWLLLTLSLKGVLAANWSVRLPNSPICAVIGSSVVLPCSYDYPQSSTETRGAVQLSAQSGSGERQQYKVLSEMWCLAESRCITPRYVFHSAGIFPDPSYQNRVQYLGQLGTKNCSLRISDLRQSDSGTYVFYLITNHTTEKMPQQSGIQLLVADSTSAVAVSAGPSSNISNGITLSLACCSPAASSTAVYRWYKSPSSNPRHTEREWSITDVTSDDSGSYYCQIQTGDRVQNSSVLPINVLYPPRNTVISVSPPGEFQDKLPVTLSCSSDANPPVHTYTWYQGEACLPTADKSVHRATQSLVTLTGRNLTYSRANITVIKYGQHCCVARNTHGSQTSSLTLRPSQAPSSSDSDSVRGVVIGVTIGILLAIIAVVAFLFSRKQKSSSHRSYVLTETTATDQ